MSAEVGVDKPVTGRARASGHMIVAADLNMATDIVVNAPAALADALAARLEEEARAALDARGAFALALTGGSMAETFFPRLSAAAVDWSRCHFFWGDERAVPPDHRESNYRLAADLWLAPAAVPPERVHRMEGERPELDEAADDYAALLVRLLGEPPRLDLVLLGVGPDGHVCSLFPGHALLGEERRLVSAVHDSPKPPPRRLTLTLPTLAVARLVVVAALGEAKAAVIRAALEDPGSELPLALVTRQAPAMLFLLDSGAASRLGPQWPRSGGAPRASSSR